MPARDTTDPAYAWDDQHDFQLDEIPGRGSVTLRLVGELDILSAPVLEQRLRKLRDQGRAVRLDLSRLEFIDSTGVHVLIEAWQRAHDAGALLEVDRHLSSQVGRVLALVQMDRILFGEDSKVG
jgi:anti-sigma B factor antagonist